MSHTPGPWEIADVYPTPQVMSAIPGIAVARVTGTSTEQARTNAHLIAPDLLEALEALCEWKETNRLPIGFSGPQMLAQAHAAIAKARGQEVTE